MDQKGIIIVGSARRNGNSKKIALYLQHAFSFPLLDLNDFSIHPYNYEHDYTDGDQFQTIVGIILQFDFIIFVTPVYWYNMSTIMKTFMDRLTDLIKVYKTQGRQLKGKQVFSVSCGGDDDMPSYFHEPFRLTSDYLDMQYHGFVHTWVSKNETIPYEVRQRLTQFREMIKGNIKS